MGMLRGVVSFFNQDGDSSYYPGGFILAASSLLQASRDSKIPINFAIPQGKRCAYSQLLTLSDLRRSYQVVFFLLDLPISTLNILILYIYEMLRAHTFAYVTRNKYLFKHISNTHIFLSLHIAFLALEWHVAGVYRWTKSIYRRLAKWVDVLRLSGSAWG